MKPSRILAPMARKAPIFLLSILLLASKSEGQDDIAPSGSSCTSHCETCPVLCSPPQPPPKHHHHSPPSHSAHPSPDEGDETALPPPAEPDMMQQNISYPYYYFYTSKAAAPCFHFHQGFSIFVLSMFLLYVIKP